MECPMSKAGNRCAKWSRSIGHSDISYFFILDCPDTTLIFSRLLQKVQSGLSDSSIIGCTQPAADRGSRERGLCSDDAKVERDANTEEWLQKPLRGGRKEMVKMSSKGTIKARDIAADVRAGLSDFDLIEKYDLSLQNQNYLRGSPLATINQMDRRLASSPEKGFPSVWKFRTSRILSVELFFGT